MSIINNLPSSNINIDGIIEEYYVYAGETISPGGFVEFINGQGGSNTVTTSASSKFGTGSNAHSCLIDTNKALIVFRDTADTSNLKGVAIVATVSNNSITYGTKSTFISNNMIDHYFASKLDTNKAIIIFRDDSNKYAKCVVASVSGTTITYGTIKTHGSSNTSYSHVCQVDTNKVVISYTEPNSDRISSLVASVSGTTISTDTRSTAASYEASTVRMCKVDTNKLFMVFSCTELTGCRIISVSGTSVSFGTQKTTTSLRNCNLVCCGCFSTTTVMIGGAPMYNPDGSYASPTLTANVMVVTISGTSCTLGTSVLINSSSRMGQYANIIPTATNRALVGYDKYIIATISGTSVTFGTQYSGIYGSMDILPLSNTDMLCVDVGRGKKCQVLFVNGTTVSNSKSVPYYETQVKNTTSNPFDGIAKTSGTGGTSTAHKDKISIYTK